MVLTTNSAATNSAAPNCLYLLVYLFISPLISLATFLNAK